MPWIIKSHMRIIMPENIMRLQLQIPNIGGNDGYDIFSDTADQIYILQQYQLSYIYMTSFYACLQLQFIPVKCNSAMKTILLISVLLGIAFTTVIPRPGPIVSHAPLVYQVSLDDPPERRWEKIVHDYAAPLKKFMDYFDMLPIPKDFFKGVEYYAKNVYQQRQFVAQVDALARISGYPFEKIFFLNFMYEFSTFKACTGILIRTAEGKVMHGRNLDFEMWGLLSNLVANVEYSKGGKKLFSIDTVIGSVFALTGIRFGAFSVNVDTRKQAHIYDDFISVLIDNAMPTCWLLRKTLEEETTYLGAMKRLKTTRIGGPVYYILAGVGRDQGIVIERDPDAVHAYYELSESQWFLIQTNYDRDYPDPLHDPRRIPVEKKMRERGNTNFTEQTLIDEFMSHWPTFNIATIMTAIMVPASGFHNTTVWYGQNPKIRGDSSLQFE